VTGLPPREWYPEIGSTQDRAIALARAGAPPGTRVVAARQTGGRGRLDHSWASPPGGLYLSVVLRSPTSHETLLPLAVGAHLAKELEGRYGVSLALKWPNDLLWTGDGPPARKVAGILLDRVPAPSGGWTAVAGIGVNVASSDELPSDVARHATALADLVQPAPPLEEVEVLVVRAAEAAAASLLAGDREVEATRALCRARLYGVGRRASVDGVPVGTIDSVGPEGELWVNTGSGRVALRAGDLRLDEDV
jgi:BirA family transcriptional regulator, biotin operon repressor / biotin---[acetyl-CoA-carboxylase] ligase